MDGKSQNWGGQLRESIFDRIRREERERIIAVLLNTESPNDFLDLIDNDLCGIPCWHEEKLRAALNP